jgi:hypothetical protein
VRTIVPSLPMDEPSGASMMGPNPGEVGRPIEVSEDELQVLLGEALARGEDPNIPFVWQDLDSELAVDVGRVRVALRGGLLLVGLPVRCDQVGGDQGEGTVLVIPIALGTPAEPAGLVGTAETPARGTSELVVAVWGETAVAATWLAFLEVCRRVAARAGEDARCQPMLPGAVWAIPGVLGVVPQARHAIDQAALA